MRWDPSGWGRSMRGRRSIARCPRVRILVLILWSRDVLSCWTTLLWRATVLDRMWVLILPPTNSSCHLVQRGILFLVLGAALAVAVQELTEFVTSPDVLAREELNIWSSTLRVQTLPVDGAGRDRRAREKLKAALKPMSVAGDRVDWHTQVTWAAVLVRWVLWWKGVGQDWALVRRIGRFFSRQLRSGGGGGMVGSGVECPVVLNPERR